MKNETFMHGWRRGFERSRGSAAFPVVVLRGAVALLFITGYLMTFMRFQGSSGEYLVYTAGMVLVCGFLLAQLKALERQYAAVWMCFALFLLAYVLRFYWIVLDPTPLKQMLHTPPYLAMLQMEAQLSAFRLTGIALIGFCGTAAIALYWFTRRQAGCLPRGSVKANAADLHPNAAHFLTAALVVLVPLLMLGLGFLAHKYHIGALGVPAGEPLPFRLKGVIHYARFLLVPGLILLLIYLADYSDRRWAARAGILLLLIHGVMELIVRNSRGGLLLVALLLLFLWMSGGIRLRRGEKLVIGGVIVLGLILLPIVTDYRFFRSFYQMPVFDALLRALTLVYDRPWLLPVEGLAFAYFRLPGTESVVAMLGLGAEPLGTSAWTVLRSPLGLEGYVTHDIYQIPREWVTSAAPGFVGALYLVGGAPAILGGSAVVALAATWLWRIIEQAAWHVRPIAQVFLLWLLFVAMTEGTPGALLLMLVGMLGCLVTFEIAVRGAIRQRRCIAGTR